MSFLIAILARLGLAAPLRKPLAYLATGLLAVALLWALWAYLSGRENADDRANQQIGATIEREKSATATIQNAEKANAAAENVRRDSDAARAECVQNARNPAAC